MHFLRVSFMLYDTVNVIHDVITTEYVYSVAVYQKYLTWLGEMIIFSPRLENYQFFQPR